MTGYIFALALMLNIVITPTPKVPYPHLEAWSDPTDGMEAIYIKAPDICAVKHDPEQGIVILLFNCETP